MSNSLVIDDSDVLDVSSPERGSSFLIEKKAFIKNAAEEYLKTLGSEASKCTVRAKLNRMARYFGYSDYLNCEWHLMRYHNITDFLSSLRIEESQGKMSTNTINGYLAALKGVAKAAWNLEQIKDHDLMRIRNIQMFRTVRKPAGRALTRTESRSFLSACDEHSETGKRDFAILMLMIGCGLRRAEITTIEMKNVFIDESRIRLIGKGNKERDVYLPDLVLDSVIEWIHLRENMLRNQESLIDSQTGFLFGRWTKNHKHFLAEHPIHPWTVGDIVNKYKNKAKESSPRLENITPHDLRRTFATRLLNKGIDISVVKNLMGHANIATTTLYDRRGEEAMKSAVKQVDL